MNNDTYIVGRLVRWSEWAARRQDSGLGYPKQVPYKNLMPRTGSSDHAPEFSDECFEMDRCVTALQTESDMIYAVVMMHYGQVNTTLDQRLEKLGCCKRTYYNKIDKAHRLILGWLNDLAAGVAIPVPSISFDKVKKIA
jgi:hypothetical protein